MGISLLNLFAFGPGSQANAPKITPEQTQVNAVLSVIKLVELESSYRLTALISGDLASAIPSSQIPNLTGAAFYALVEDFRVRIKIEQDIQSAVAAYRLNVKNWGQNAPPHMSEEQWKKNGSPFPPMPVNLQAALLSIDVAN